MKIRKYNGCGNDFIILPFEDDRDNSELAKKLCQEFSTDGMILVKEKPIEMVFYNQDGTEAPMCGNGIRTFARYLVDQDLVASDCNNFDVITQAGIMRINIISRQPFLVEVNMGQAEFASEKTKMTVEDTGFHQINISGNLLDLHTVFIGTIHTVVFVDDTLAMTSQDLGEVICNLPLFSQKTNVNFLEIIDRKNIKVKTYERGVGWTLACGTGCCGSVYIGQKEGLLDDEVCVHLEKGSLTISNRGDIFMTGPAEFEMEREII
jgi:diaminopimelate epimerase